MPCCKPSPRLVRSDESCIPRDNVDLAYYATRRSIRPTTSSRYVFACIVVRRSASRNGTNHLAPRNARSSLQTLAVYCRSNAAVMLLLWCRLVDRKGEHRTLCRTRLQKFGNRDSYIAQCRLSHHTSGEQNAVVKTLALLFPLLVLLVHRTNPYSRLKRKHSRGDVEIGREFSNLIAG